MSAQINIINPEPVIKAFEDLACGKVKVAKIESKHFEKRQEETRPLEGIELKKAFPFCCNNHKALFKIGVELLAKFPDCCEGHRKLKTAAWFNKRNYSYLPEKFVKTLTYTIDCVLRTVASPTWYKDITDYVDYTVKSFGQFPEGFGEPLGLSVYLYNVEKNIETNDEIPQAKKATLIDYIKSYSIKPVEETTKTDLNILLIAYHRWLDLFPFELESYFKDAKKHYEKHLPLIDGKPDVNRYSGMAKATLHTKESLFQTLLNITDTLLKEVNGATLFEKGLITDTQKIQIELISQERKQRLKDGYTNSSPNEERKFRRMIKDWLQDERVYWKKMEPLLKGHGERDLHFDTIDEDFGPKKIPFEIKLIYKQLYNGGGGQRYMELKGPGYHFFTPYTLYNWFIEDFRKGELFTDYLEPLTFENVQPYYKSYGDGFLKGYHGFDDKIKASTAIFQDKESIAQRVFESINTNIQGLRSYGFGEVEEKRVQTIQSKIWFEAGVKAGENYKAWYFVLNNSSYFVSLFRSYPPYIKLYHAAANYWKSEPGGEGMYSHLVKLLEEIGQSSPEDQLSDENDFLLSTIEDYLCDFKENMTETDYKVLIQAHKQYFETGKFPMPEKEIKVFGKVAVKKFGWALNELYRNQKPGSCLAVEYVEFGKRYISIFKRVPFDKKNFVKCLLYKYYTTKTH